MKLLNELTKGIIRENPTLVILLGLCPTLAVTTGLANAVGMGISLMFVLVGSNVIIAMFKDFFPKKIRIPCYIVVIAAFTTIVQMALKAYVPDLDEALGIFIPLIVVNCIVLGRAEAFANRSGVIASLLDGIGMGIGFTLALCLIAFIRETLGKWQLFGIPITAGGFHPAAVLIMAPGALMVLGLVLGAKARLEQRRKAMRLATEAASIASVETATAFEEADKLREAEARRKEKAAAKKEGQAPGSPEGVAGAPGGAE